MSRRWLSIGAVLSAAMMVTTAPAGAKAFSYKSKSRYASIEFSYSAEAAAVPELVKKFRADLSKEQTKAIACGKEESAVRKKMGDQGIACESSTKIATMGQTGRMLSLSRAYWAFTGGAHGNGATTSQLWDRRLKKQITFSALFSPARGYEKILRDPYCRGLNAERTKRRGDNYRPGGGNATLARMFSEFDDCPDFSKLAVIPADGDRNGQFDRIHVIAAPYTAGSFAEGEYDVSLPVTARLISALKPEYRASFSAQRQ